jgi:hypothetical protein
MPPLSFTTEEQATLRQLSEPVAYGRRAEFLRQVAAELEACGQAGEDGVGLVHRVGAQVQRRFVLEAKRVPLDREMPRAWRAQDGP